ncbi:MAG: PTS sugar transporter subunit IIA [Phycisphaerales bacterium]|jgi:mannitol/fructose-specific phosphotransferase system IIA component (Ntr-type)|nr:PTS sugar transporter subunit IIA [Phycisphaerales bacterium]
MQIATLISPDVIRVPLLAEDRRSAIRELVELLGAQGVVSDVEGAIETTWAREQERTTGIGEGLAVPHGRCRCVNQLVLAIGRPAAPIDFQSFDQKPVRLVVLVLSPLEDTASHIQVLGGISRLLSDRLTREAAYSAESAEDLAEILQGAT